MACVALLSPTALAGKQRKRVPKGASTLDDNFYTYFNKKPLEPQVGRQEIAPLAVAPAAPPRAPTEDSPWALRWPGINNPRNGRLSTSVALATSPRLAFRSQLQPDAEPVALLTGPRRIVVVGAAGWALFEGSGRTLASGSSIHCSPALDDQAVRLITGDAEANLVFHRLSDGARELAAQPMVSLNLQRIFVTARGNSTIMLSTLEDPELHRPPKQRTVLETIDLNYRGEGPSPTAAVVRDETVVLAAMAGGRLVLAATDRVYFFEPDLTVHSIWTGSFRAFGLSLDEAGNLYLLAGSGSAVHLWKLTPEARRAWEVPLPQSAIWPVQPPIVGYDHTVYLVSEKQILAISADGRVLWEKPGTGPIKGAFVTANDLLVTTEGSQIAAWNLAGERKLLFDAGEPLTTPPVMTEGHLFVASSSHLFSVALK
jgi:hypothetical protein